MIVNILLVIGGEVAEMAVIVEIVETIQEESQGQEIDTTPEETMKEDMRDIEEEAQVEMIAKETNTTETDTGEAEKRSRRDVDLLE